MSIFGDYRQKEEGAVQLDLLGVIAFVAAAATGTVTAFTNSSLDYSDAVAAHIHAIEEATPQEKVTVAAGD